MISAVKVLAAPVVIRLPPVVTQSGLMERPALLSGKPDSGFRHPFAQRLSRHDQAVVRRNPLSHKIDYGTMTSGAGPGIAVVLPPATNSVDRSMWHFANSGFWLNARTTGYNTN